MTSSATMDRVVPVADGPSASHPQKQDLITPPPSSQTSPQRSWVISPSSSLLSSQVCGKRFRSNSSTSSLGSSDGGGSGTSSGFSRYSTFSSGGGSGSGSGSGSDSALSDAVESPTTSASNASSPEFERGCPSPGVAKRKIARCAKQQTACTTATAPSAASVSSQCATSAGSSDAEVTGLDGAVQAFGLSSRRQSPIDDRSSSSTSTTTSSLLSHSSSSSSSSSSAPELPRAKVAVVDQLVDAATATLDAIWNSPLPMDEEPPEVSCSISSLPLHIFIRETLRRSRTSCSTLQAALLYCLRSAPAVRRTRLHIAHLRLQVYRTDPAAVEQIHDSLCCPRRNFLAAVMVASKFLQDKNFSNRAWSKLTGLPIKELGNVERGFLGAIGWDLNIKPNEWDSWTRKLAQARLSGDRHGHDTAEASSSANVNAMHSKSHTAAAAAPAPAPTSTPPLPSAVAQLRTARSRDDHTQSACSSHGGANSSCPTPTPSTPTASNAPSIRPSRVLLARSQSDDAPFRAFDMDAVDRRSAVTATDKTDGAAKVAPTLSSRATADDVIDPDTTATPVHSSARATECPPPFPMPRHFVRNAASFSFAAHHQKQ